MLTLPVLVGAGALALILVVALALSFLWREVVPTNVVHIVQTRKRTVSYGTHNDSGNVYYAIPSYVPIFGLSRTILPVNNFALDLNNYRAYDKDRVPFELHVTAFFRIADTNKAAERVANFAELRTQLEQVVKGAVRKILASNDVHTIMTSRATFGEQFTAEVATELANWGVEPVKSIELMDIKDTEDSSVIANIMAKKSSHIAMESRAEVASNHQQAETAEINAKRTVELSRIEAEKITNLSKVEADQATALARVQQQQQVGERTAQQKQAVGVAEQKAEQQVKTEAALTKQKEMEIVAVQTQRQAQIQKDAALVAAAQQQEVARVAAEQAREVTVIQSNAQLEKARVDATAAVVRVEQEKAVAVTQAEAQLASAKLGAEAVASAAKGSFERTKLEAEGITLTGTARAEAEKALQLAPVEAQTKLAKEIGSNKEYQSYLVTIRQIEAQQAVGIVQADALKHADIKVFANTGSASAGIQSLGDLFGSIGGQKLGAFLSSLKETAPPKDPPLPITTNGNGEE